MTRPRFAPQSSIGVVISAMLSRTFYLTLVDPESPTRTHHGQ
jgi:hypothetical protein